MDASWKDAVTRGDAARIRLLLEGGMDANARDRHGQTGLMLAAHAGHGAVVDVLLAHGASLDVTAKFGLSALMLAVVAGHTDIARALAHAGADRTLKGSGAPGFAGKTAGDLAAARGLLDLAGELNPDRSAPL
jgi:ankyrin repeat protein